MLIHNLAKRLNISARAIRFYEEKGLIRPLKNEQNQYRTFSDQDAWRLQTIVALREVGMSVDEIKRVLGELDAGHPQVVLEYLELQRSAMFKQWIELKQMIETADKMIDMLYRNEQLEADAMFAFAEGAKRLRATRENWRDRWNFDARAEQYDALVTEEEERDMFQIHKDYGIALDAVRNTVSAHPGEIGLDFGVGTGNLAGRFVAQGIRMAGVDGSRQMLNICKQKYPDVEAKLGSLFAVPFFDSTFDFIVSSFVFQHQSAEQNLLALDEMHRVLKPHGRICIVDVMFRDPLHESEHLAVLQNEERREELSMLHRIESTYVSELVDWFERHEYVTKVQPIHELLYLIYAVRIH